MVFQVLLPAIGFWGLIKLFGLMSISCHKCIGFWGVASGPGVPLGHAFRVVGWENIGFHGLRTTYRVC
jgi:hypothetical protein